MTSVLCIAGLDPSGNAGLSADFRALHFLGIRCLPLVTTLTVQNATSFYYHQPVPHKLLSSQLDAIFETEKPCAVKLGVLGNSEIAHLLVDYLSDLSLPLITDPVMNATTGFNLVDDDLFGIYKSDLFPISDMITPNAEEAAAFTGMRIEGTEDAGAACQRLLDLGPKSVLLKGGHFSISRGSDVFLDSSGQHMMEGVELKGNIRGTGCAYSSLIAGYVSLGLGNRDAFIRAKADLNNALTASAGRGLPFLDFFETRHIDCTNAGDTA